MQKIIEFRDVTSSGHRAGPSGQVAANAPGPQAAVPSIEPIYAVVDSLSRTLECIKAMCASVPNGPAREKLEIERTNLVIGLFVARIAAMRVSPADTAAVAEPKFPLARSG
ncbi:hypothetical protein [Bradyrhizobium sp. CB3481]|uniref:hypothetical protein n=1 Tax=Bradyrhizobium sp. CB3481 TaxID=3039158 RepID=UPI0024B14A65|nr:hypothetical protein [Bradyrhizobium sp. CB3481]WFU16035.1 hypothetical protein QA643_34615 [Bradyrhizobium sp. CB3481]